MKRLHNNENDFQKEEKIKKFHFIGMAFQVDHKI